MSFLSLVPFAFLWRKSHLFRSVFLPNFIGRRSFLAFLIWLVQRQIHSFCWSLSRLRIVYSTLSLLGLPSIHIYSQKPHPDTLSPPRDGTAWREPGKAALSHCLLYKTWSNGNLVLFLRRYFFKISSIPWVYVKTGKCIQVLSPSLSAWTLSSRDATAFRPTGSTDRESGKGIFSSFLTCFFRHLFNTWRSGYKTVTTNEIYQRQGW